MATADQQASSSTVTQQGRPRVPNEAAMGKGRGRGGYTAAPPQSARVVAPRSTGSSWSLRKAPTDPGLLLPEWTVPCAPLQWQESATALDRSRDRFGSTTLLKAGVDRAPANRGKIDRKLPGAGHTTLTTSYSKLFKDDPDPFNILVCTHRQRYHSRCLRMKRATHTAPAATVRIGTRATSNAQSSPRCSAPAAPASSPRSTPPPSTHSSPTGAPPRPASAPVTALAHVLKRIDASPRSVCRPSTFLREDTSTRTARVTDDATTLANRTWSSLRGAHVHAGASAGAGLCRSPLPARPWAHIEEPRTHAGTGLPADERTAAFRLKPLRCAGRPLDHSRVLRTPPLLLPHFPTVFRVMGAVRYAAAVGLCRSETVAARAGKVGNRLGETTTSLKSEFTPERPQQVRQPPPLTIPPPAPQSTFLLRSHLSPASQTKSGNAFTTGARFPTVPDSKLMPCSDTQPGLEKTRWSVATPANTGFRVHRGCHRRPTATHVHTPSLH
jgi:hypothetical protein